MKKWLCMLAALLLLILPCAQAEQAGNAEPAEESPWLNILFMGGDALSTQKYGRTDCMMIVSINRDECSLKLTSIMRDTWVDLPGMDITGKINAANVYGGPELAVETVNSYFGTDIESYIMVNMYDLVKIIDLAGGVDMYVTQSEKNHTNQAASAYLESFGRYSGETKLRSSGNVHMNGLLAVAYSRDRSTDNDYGRVMRQQKLLLALAETFQNMDIDDLMELADKIQERLETNLDSEALKELALTGMSVEVDAVEQFRIPADGTFEAGMREGVWKIVPDFEANAALLDEFIYGVGEDTETNGEE